MIGIHRIKHCIENLNTAPTWMLECAASDANWHEMYREELMLRTELKRRNRS